jgi:hypothetical protein
LEVSKNDTIFDIKLKIKIMNTEQLTFLRDITRKSKDKRELNLIYNKFKTVNLTGKQDERFNLIMDIRTMLINKL